MIKVDAEDNLTVIFPNKYQKSSKVPGGYITLPEGTAPIALSGESFGSALLVAFFSAEPVNLLSSIEPMNFTNSETGARNIPGTLLDSAFIRPEVNQGGFAAMAEESTFHGGIIEVAIHR